MTLAIIICFLGGSLFGVMASATFFAGRYALVQWRQRLETREKDKVIDRAFCALRESGGRIRLYKRLYEQNEKHLLAYEKRLGELQDLICQPWVETDGEEEKPHARRTQKWRIKNF